MNQTLNDDAGPVHSFFSAEAVRFDLALSGPAPRMLAYAIDFAIVIGLSLLLLALIIESLPMGSALEGWLHGEVHEAVRKAAAAMPNPGQPVQIPGLLLAFFVLAQFIIETGYFIFWEIVTGGSSPGKFFVRLRVVRDDNRPLDLRSSVLRNLVRLVDMLPAEYLIGLLAMLFSSSAQRLGDHLAGTIVVRLDRPEAAAEIPELKHGTTIILTREQLGRLGPVELQLIRRILRRSSHIPANRREPLVEEVANAMRRRLELAASPGANSFDFLCELLATAERSLRNR